MISHTSHPIVDIDGISKLNMLIMKSVYHIEFGFASDNGCDASSKRSHIISLDNGSFILTY